MNAPRGFTLIELAIVIVIAGILAAVAIPLYQGFIDDAKWTEAESALGAIKTSIDTYVSRYGSARFTSALNVVGSADGSEFSNLGFNTESFTRFAYWHGQAFELRIVGGRTYNVSVDSALLTAAGTSQPNTPGSITLIVNDNGAYWTRFGSAQ